MIAFLQSIKIALSWKTCFETGSYLYQENSVTKKRRCVLRDVPLGIPHEPLDLMWIKGHPRGTCSLGSLPMSSSAVAKAFK